MRRAKLHVSQKEEALPWQVEVSSREILEACCSCQLLECAHKFHLTKKKQCQKSRKYKPPNVKASLPELSLPSTHGSEDTGRKPPTILPAPRLPWVPTRAFLVGRSGATEWGVGSTDCAKMCSPSEPQNPRSPCHQKKLACLSDGLFSMVDQNQL